VAGNAVDTDIQGQFLAAAERCLAGKERLFEAETDGADRDRHPARGDPL
jgi:hypothetical protein